VKKRRKGGSIKKKKDCRGAHPKLGDCRKRTPGEERQKISDGGLKKKPTED